MPVPTARLSSLVLCLAAVACDPDVNDSNDAATADDAVEVAVGERVVATVNGQPITANRVAELSGITKRPPREVVERLINFELLAAEASRRGHGQSRDVQRATRKAMIQRYLEEDFEAGQQPEDIPEAALKAAYRANRSRYVQDRRYKVVHILVEARERRASPAKRKQAQRLAAEIHRAAQKATTPEEFQQVGKRFEGRGFDLVIEDVAPVHKHARLARPFIEASLQLKKIGDISPPTETRYGTHVIYLSEIREAINVSYAEASEELRAAAHPSWMAHQFEVLSSELGMVDSRRRGGTQ